VPPNIAALLRYPTMELQEIMDLPVSRLAACPLASLSLVPNALLTEGLHVMKAWGFTYNQNVVWPKGAQRWVPDGRGVGFYFRNVN